MPTLVVGMPTHPPIVGTTIDRFGRTAGIPTTSVGMAPNVNRSSGQYPVIVHEVTTRGYPLGSP